MLNLILGIIPGLLKLGSEMIEDPDKRNEFAFKTLEMQHEMMTKVLEMKTYPWIDALVKLAMASNAIIKGLFRPVGATAALVFLAYCSINGIELNPVVEGIFASLAPAWGYSRYKEKQAENEAKSGDLGW